MEENKNTQLTDEQVEQIIDATNEAIAGTSLEKIAQFPSNNGQEETDPATREPGEKRMMQVAVDPNTGEHAVIGPASIEDDETFEEMLARIENSDMEAIAEAPITETEIIDYISKEKNGSDTVLQMLTDDFSISDDAVRQLLKIVNKKIKKEDVDVYKEFPDEIKKMVDKYIISQQVPIFSKEGKRFRNMVCEELINEFITNISLNRTMTDFNKELESLFTKASEEIGDMAIGYTSEKNAQLRKFAENMEDSEKKEKLLNVIERLDDAYSLNSLKEFAKKCKIKKYELERPDKVFKGFLSKYMESPYNIYDINVVRPIIGRYINADSEVEYNTTDINAFFIAFCKQCQNMHSNVPIDHAYMYNVIFNISLIDINKGDNKHISDTFVQNVRDVIDNLRIRNNNFK